MFVVYITIHKYKFNAFYSIKATKSAFFFEQIYHAILACNLFLGPKGPVVGSKRYRHRIAAAYPRKGCVLWTEGDSEGVLSTGGRYFVDADGELRPPVHTGGAICGRKVPQWAAHKAALDSTRDNSFSSCVMSLESLLFMILA